MSHPDQDRPTGTVSAGTPDDGTSGWRPDILGAGYSALDLPLGTDPDGEGELRATLVRHDAAPAEPGACLLYVHGLSDYFFQTHLAEYLAGRGIATYALDLRKCGRSRDPGQTPHFVTDFARYDAELDRALEVVVAEHPGIPVLAAAHSTGGLVVPLWLARRRDRGALDPVRGIVLDSPWFQLDVPARIRPAFDAAMRVVGRRSPYYRLPLPTSDLYGTSTHADHQGDFPYDLDLKPFGGVGIRAGWIRAVRQAQRELQAGLHLPLPVLLLRSTASSIGRGPKDVDTDLVLDVRSMQRFAPAVSDDVTDAPVAGARHDVLLSRPEVLVQVFDALGAWLDTWSAGPGARSNPEAVDDHPEGDRPADHHPADHTEEYPR